MNPILIDIPTRISTERLILRCPNQGDGMNVNLAIRASINELKPWLPFAQNVPEVTDTEINLRNAQIDFLKRDSFRFLIFLKESGEFLGSCSLHDINWDIPKFEIGYWIDSRYSGYGYMNEAIKALTEFALNVLNGRRIVIRVESGNLKSRAIPEKLGFTLEGILRNDDLSVDGNQLTDTCIYAKIKY